MIKRGDFVKESGSYGLVIAAGPKTFDVIWIGGGTSRYRHGMRAIAATTEVSDWERKHLIAEARAAREERRTGAGIKRGQVWPSH